MSQGRAPGGRAAGCPFQQPRHVQPAALRMGTSSASPSGNALLRLARLASSPSHRPLRPSGAQSAATPGERRSPSVARAPLLDVQHHCRSSRCDRKRSEQVARREGGRTGPTDRPPTGHRPNLRAHRTAARCRRGSCVRRCRLAVASYGGDAGPRGSGRSPALLRSAAC